MDIQQLITMLENKISTYRNMLDRAIEGGDIDAVTNIETDIFNCQETLSKLKTLI